MVQNCCSLSGANVKDVLSSCVIPCIKFNSEAGHDLLVKSFYNPAKHGFYSLGPPGVFQEYIEGFVYLYGFLYCVIEYKL